MKRFFVGKTVLAAAVVAISLTVAVPNGADAGAVNLEDSSSLKVQSIKELYMANARLEAIKAGEAPSSVSAGSADGWLTKVDASKVNMVTNRLDANVTATDFSGKTYFVAGTMGNFAMGENQSTRSAIDPTTNAKVDKANAVTMADASGRVHYFSSENSVQEFFAKAASNTAYGYSSAK